MASILATLCNRGDVVAIDKGRLTITPASGRPVPDEWLSRNRLRLIAEAARMVNVVALEYVGYSTGSYIVDTKTQRRADGITMQFRCVTSGEERHAIFNACVRRRRASKHGTAGSPLPRGRFSVGERAAFLRFWESTGLPYRRLCEFHDCMGKLSGLIFTATLKHDRVEAATLRPLTLTLAPDDLNQPGKLPANFWQPPGKNPAKPPGKETAQTQQPQGLQTFSTTGQTHHGNTVTRERGHTGAPLPPELQSIDEWLAELNGRAST